MKNEDLEQAYDVACVNCVSASKNANDGGRLPCYVHKALWLSRDVSVIRTTGLMDGDWTHTAIDTQSIRYFVNGILEEFSESTLSCGEFVQNLGLTVETMPIDELEKVPEL